VPAVSRVTLGINYSWYRVNEGQVAECAVRRSGVLWGGGILDQYQDPSVRQTVRENLRDMHSAGLDAIRTFISGAYEPFNHHNEGVIGTTTGEISAQNQENIKNFVADIAAAGFRDLEFSYGFLLAGNIFCKRVEWGDCFEPQRTDENWRFMATATELINRAAGSMPHRFDLNNEGCPSRSMPAQTVENAARYLSTIASRFQQQFGHNWLISCPHSAHADRLQTLLELLGQSGLVPKYVEVHSYSDDSNMLRGELTIANSLAAQINASVIVGELRYHSEAQASIISEFMRSNSGNRIVEILQWPLAHPENHCPIDTSPPYDPGPYAAFK